MGAEPKRFYVYIMASLSGTLYVGVTNNVARRSFDHKLGEGSAFTKRYDVNRLVYYECFQYIGNAIRREKEIKGWRREEKIALIEALNPSWRDLNRDFERQFQPSAEAKQTLAKALAENRDSSPPLRSGSE